MGKEQLQDLSLISQVPNSVPDNVLVSVCVQTYNHEAFIKDCLNGILNQNTNFDFEILLGEDDSQDDTRNICEEYADKHPDKIRLFLHSRQNVINIGGKPTGRFNLLNNLNESKGKFIAICEGDDYWTDPDKLQKQLDFLESHNEYSACGGLYFLKKEKELFEDQHLKSNKNQLEFGTIDFLGLRYSPIHTSTFFIRKSIISSKYWDWDIFRITPSGDIFILFVASIEGKIRRLTEHFSVRNIAHSSSITSKRKVQEVYEPIMKTLDFMNTTSREKYKSKIDSEKKFWSESLNYRSRDFSITDAFYLMKYKARIGITFRDIIYLLRKRKKI